MSQCPIGSVMADSNQGPFYILQPQPTSATLPPSPTHLRQVRNKLGVPKGLIVAHVGVDPCSIDQECLGSGGTTQCQTPEKHRSLSLSGRCQPETRTPGHTSVEEAEKSQGRTLILGGPSLDQAVAADQFSHPPQYVAKLVSAATSHLVTAETHLPQLQR